MSRTAFPSCSPRRFAGATAVLAGALTGTLGVAPLAAASTSTRTAASAIATVRAAHLSPDMPGVDIYLTSFTGRTSVFVRDATYGAVSPYRQVPPGNYTFTLRRHNAAMTSAPLESWTFAAKGGDAYTAAAVGEGARHKGVILDDNLTPPSAGHANVRLIQASSRSGTTNVVALNGPVIARDAQFPSSTGYASVKAGTWPLKATGDGRSATADVSVPAGSVTSLILLDTRSGGTRLTSVVDAAGAARHSGPKGSVNAGGGGTADRVVDRPQSGFSPALAGGGGAVALLMFAAFAWRRRDRTGRA